MYLRECITYQLRFESRTITYAIKNGLKCHIGSINFLKCGSNTIFIYLILNIGDTNTRSRLPWIILACKVKRVAIW